MGSLVRMFAAAAVGVVAMAGTALAVPAYTTSGVMMRAGPGGDYPALVRLRPGSAVELNGCVEGYDWCDVYAAGTHGFVRGSKLDAVYGGRRVLLPSFGLQLGLPIIGFDVGSYWGRYYQGRSFYGERERFGGYGGPGPRPGYGVRPGFGGGIGPRPDGGPEGRPGMGVRPGVGPGFAYPGGRPPMGQPPGPPHISPGGLPPRPGGNNPPGDRQPGPPNLGKNPPGNPGAGGAPGMGRPPGGGTPPRVGTPPAGAGGNHGGGNGGGGNNGSGGGNGGGQHKGNGNGGKDKTPPPG